MIIILNWKRPRRESNQEHHVNFFLFFTDRSWEMPFLKKNDPLFNVYMLGAVPVLLGIMAIQLILYQK